MASRRLVLSLAAPIFTALCDKTLRHRDLLTVAHIAYYTCSLLLAVLRSLPAVTVVIILREIFVSGCEPTLNNAALAALNDSAKPAAFGSLRLYGSIGWGLASAIGPLIADRYFSSDLITLLYVQVILGLPVLILIYFYIDLSPALFRRQAAAASSSSPTNWALVRTLSAPALHAMTVAVLQGAALGAIQTTSFIYFSSLSIAPSALGAAVTLSCVAEAVLFSVDATTSKLLGGPRRAFNAAAAANAACLLLYAAVQFSPSPTAAFMLAEVLCGATHAVFLSASLTLAENLAPPGAATAAQGVLTALLYGVGPAIGALAAGISYEKIGVPASYIALAVAQFIILVPPFAPSAELNENVEQACGKEAAPLLPTRCTQTLPTDCEA